MAITSYTVQHAPDSATVTVVSDLTGDVVYYWYRDGRFCGATSEPVRAFELVSGEQFAIEAVDSTDDEFDPLTDGPTTPPATLVLYWIRSIAADVARYRVEVQTGGSGDYATVETIDAGDYWDFEYTTDRLTDGQTYRWRIVPIDTAGNDGTPITLAATVVCRTPDGPGYGITFDEGTATVTFT